MLDKFHTVIKILIVHTALFLIVLLTGCSSSRPVSRDDDHKQENSKDGGRTLADYEATLNPSDYDHEIDIVDKKQFDENKQKSNLEIPKDSLIIREEIVQGFRIQIFSSSGVDDATLIKEIAAQKFPDDSVYVVYDVPVYKVRVGDFLNRYEANQRLPEFMDKGYRDAWVVPDRIIQRKFVHVPFSR